MAESPSQPSQIGVQESALPDSAPIEARLADSELPPLFADRTFWGMTSTQFLGAFNDNLFKQLVLLLAISGALAGVADGEKGTDSQPLAMFIFAAPFMLFSGYAGFISERNSKRTVIVLCKAAEVGIILLGLAAFLLWNITGLAGLLFVLFLMGTHSAFFGPSKYGILPELFRERDLPQANGLILMTTFLAIIFGTGFAGVLKDILGDQKLWAASLICLVIAVTGTLTSLMIRRVPAAEPNLKFRLSALAIPGEIIALFRRDRPLLQALLAYCMFWLIGGLVQPSVNALGKLQFEVNDTKTSIMAACMGLGIAFGAMLAGQLSRNRVNFKLTKIGAWLIVVVLAIISIPGAGKFNFLGYYGTVTALVFLGAAAGLFAVPLQVFIQSRPPESLKGERSPQ